MREIKCNNFIARYDKYQVLEKKNNYCDGNIKKIILVRHQNLLQGAI